MKRTPKYVLVAEKLRSDIEKRYGPGDRLPAEPQLCARYNVSMITVRQAVKELAGRGIVSREQGRGTFVLDRRPRNPLKRVAYIYQTTFSSLEQDPVTGEAFAGVFAACSAQGISTLTLPVGDVTDSSPPDRRLLSPVTYRGLGADGLIIYAGPFPEEYIRGVAESSSLPVVLLNGNSPSIPSVSVDHRGGTRQALEHLYALGHRRIGFLYYHRAGRLSPSFDERYKAYVAFRRKHRLEELPSLVAGVDAKRPAGRSEATALLAAGPTAIMAANDRLAMAVYDAARDLGWSVPRDLSVVGFDDAPCAVNACPPLTTVRAPVRELGSEAVALLRRMADDSGRHKSRRVRTGLVVRDSTAPARRKKTARKSL